MVLKSIYKYIGKVNQWTSAQRTKCWKIDGTMLKTQNTRTIENINFSFYFEFVYNVFSSLDYHLPKSSFKGSPP